MTLNDPYPSFKVTQFFDAEYLRNGTTYRHSVIEILIGTIGYTTYAPVSLRQLELLVTIINILGLDIFALAICRHCRLQLSIP